MSKLLKQSKTIATPPADSLPVAGGSGIGTCRPGKPASAFYELHNESRRQYVITVSGRVEVETGDGTKLEFGPGDVIFATDLTGQGHSI